MESNDGMRKVIWVGNSRGYRTRIVCIKERDIKSSETTDYVYSFLEEVKKTNSMKEEYWETVNSFFNNSVPGGIDGRGLSDTVFRSVLIDIAKKSF